MNSFDSCHGPEGHQTESKTDHVNCPTVSDVLKVHKYSKVDSFRCQTILPTMSTIPDFKGNQFTPTSLDYGDHWDQYATSTYSVEHNMHPGIIAQPIDKEDIKKAIAYAKKEKKAIAIRTGGHQYSGASSTGDSNILLDLSQTFRDPSRDRVAPDINGHVFTSVSWSLGEFNAFLGENSVGLHAMSDGYRH